MPEIVKIADVQLGQIDKEYQTLYFWSDGLVTWTDTRA